MVVAAVRFWGVDDEAEECGKFAAALDEAVGTAELEDVDAVGGGATEIPTGGRVSAVALVEAGGVDRDVVALDSALLDEEGIGLHWVDLGVVALVTAEKSLSSDSRKA